MITGKCPGGKFTIVLRNTRGQAVDYTFIKHGQVGPISLWQDKALCERWQRGVINDPDEKLANTWRVPRRSENMRVDRRGYPDAAKRGNYGDDKIIDASYKRISYLL